MTDNRTSRRHPPAATGSPAQASRLLVLAGGYCAVIVLPTGVVGATAWAVAAENEAR